MKMSSRTLALLAAGLLTMPLIAAAVEDAASSEAPVPTLYSTEKRDCSTLRATDPMEWEACIIDNATLRQNIVEPRPEVSPEARNTRRTMNAQLREAAQQAREVISNQKQELRQSRMTLKERVKAMRSDLKQEAKLPLFERILQKQQERLESLHGKRVDLIESQFSRRTRNAESRAEEIREAREAAEAESE